MPPDPVVTCLVAAAWAMPLYVMVNQLLAKQPRLMRLRSLA
jgi:hypothetical protein